MTGFDRLIEGYRRFRRDHWEDERERWEELSAGQSPKVMVIACSDSRVDPAQIFDARPGEMFVIRNVAALVPPFEASGGGQHGVSAALEFAVTQLEVEDIVVMGHGACGGCAAALTAQFRDAPRGEGGFIAAWLALLESARSRVRICHGTGHGPVALRAMEHEAVKTSLDNLRSFPCIAAGEREGRLKLHGAYFAIADGILHRLDEPSGAFRPV